MVRRRGEGNLSRRRHGFLRVNACYQWCRIAANSGHARYGATAALILLAKRPLCCSGRTIAGICRPSSSSSTRWHQRSNRRRSEFRGSDPRQLHDCSGRCKSTSLAPYMGMKNMTSVLPSCPPTASPPRPFFAPGHRLRHNRARRMHWGTSACSWPISSLRRASGRQGRDCTGSLARNRAHGSAILPASDLVGFGQTVGWLQTNGSRKASVDFSIEWSHKRRSAFISPACDSANLFILYVVRRRGPLTPLHKSLCNAGSSRSRGFI